MLTVLGFDPAVQGTFWAIINLDDERGRQSAASRWGFVNRTSQSYLNEVSAGEVDLIAIEDYDFNARYPITPDGINTIKTVGRLEAEAKLFDIPFLVVKRVQVKSALKVPVQTPRQHIDATMKAAVSRFLPISQMMTRDHIAAISVALAAAIRRDKQLEIKLGPDKTGKDSEDDF